MKIRRIPIGELEVTIYYDPGCQPNCWALKNVPVRQCPYYLCLKNEDETEFKKYVSVAERRHPNWAKQHSYDHLIELKDSIAKDGYLPHKAKNEPMMVWKGSNLLK